jgi:hypothetical protein
MIRTHTLPTSLPVFTISDIHRFRSERDYVEALLPFFAKPSAV